MLNVGKSLESVPQFVGNIWYVDGDNGSDLYSGRNPYEALATIAAAIALLSTGDAITVKEGTYTDVGLDLNVVGCEIWFEIGSVIEPASGVGLTVSANYCKILGEVLIAPTAAAGVLVSGDNCVLKNIKSICATHAGTDCYQITGSGVTIYTCVGGFPAATYAGFNITGDQGSYYECSTVGNTTSYGFHISGSCDTGVLSACTSVGHQTSGYYIATGSENWTIVDCSSGASDGKWRDIDEVNVWSGFTFPETKYKSLTLNNTHDYNLFKITGNVELLEIYGHVTTVLAGANTDVSFQLYSVTGVDNITKATDTDMGTAPVGSLVIKTEDPDKALKFLTSGTPSVDKGTEAKKKGCVLTADNAADTYIRWVVGGDNDTSGALDFHVQWRPLSDDGFLEPV